VQYYSQQRSARQQQSNIASLPLTGAFNLSSKAFTVDALLLLNCGLKFIPTPIRGTSMGAVQDSIDRFARNVRFRMQYGEDREFDPRFYVPKPEAQPQTGSDDVEQFLFDIRYAVVSCYSAAGSAAGRQKACSNLDEGQRYALQTMLIDGSIVVKPGDKNLGLVVLDKPDYDVLLLSALTITSHCVPVQAPDVRRLVRKAQYLIDLHAAGMDDGLHKFLTHFNQSEFQLPQPYAMPKVHKMSVVDRAHLSELSARLLIPCHSWVTTGMSQYLAYILNGVCIKKFSHVLPDSRTLIRSLDGACVPRDSILVTYDVVDMYPSIDRAAAVAAAAATVPARQRSMVLDMAAFVLKQMYCQRDGTVYQQTAGVAMGTACAPPLANHHHHVTN
jgi:hypothetical protein